MGILPLMFGLVILSAITETANMVVTGSHSTVLLFNMMEAIVELRLHRPILMDNAAPIHVELENVLDLIPNIGVLVLETLLELTVKALLMDVLAVPVRMVLVV